MKFSGTTFTSKEACVHALRHPELSSNPGGATAGSANLLFMDSDDHARLRGVVREVVSRLEPLPEEVLAEISGVVRGLDGRTELDLVADFARPVAAVVASAVLAVEEELSYALLDQISQTAANLDVWIDGTTPANTAMHRVVRFFLKARAVPGGGLDLLRRAAEAGEITEDELLVTPVMLTHAAYENSMNFLAASALRISQSGELAARFTASRGRGRTVRKLVNEICPTRHVMRRAVAPVAIADTPVAADERIAIWIGPPNGLAFGIGDHTCPGIRIALAEAEFALTEITPLLEGGWEVVDVAEKNHFVFHGLTRALVRRDLS
ncbi:hypothetical protein [Streptomyces sp. B6B3]|uniref:hypothetical protein n=1 Tax=Streptomyces sp. B6B3 TaxID=3153570 RepID=UPI00325CFAFD